MGERPEAVVFQCKAQSLRKTITNALNNEAPMHLVQALAGHADIRTTQGYYMKKDFDAEAAARHIQIR